MTNLKLRQNSVNQIFNPWSLFFFLLTEVRQGSRRSASGVKEKCAGLKEKCVRGQGEVIQLNTTHLAEALLLDHWCTSP